MRQSFKRACATVQAAYTEKGVDIDLTRVRPYDLRHSYATALLAST